jgi:putative Mg2+ transporter-C (MgtC) family protein
MSGGAIVLAAQSFHPWEVLQEELGELADFDNTFRLLLRLLFALGLAALVGEDRERVGKPAGLRTHMLVSLGAALFVVVPQMAGMANAEISRVIQGALAGIGFIGAGAILKLSQEKKVQGLTTAAGIWVAAGIGLAAGMGRLWSAAVAALTAYLVLAGVGWLERRLGKKTADKGPAGPGKEPNITV